MSENLLIIFIKNQNLGKVKTRLAKTIGTEAALKVYLSLIQHTHNTAQDLNCNKTIYYSENIVDDDIWDPSTYQKHQQHGKNLGERMYNAFTKGFDDGYKNIILIGSDLPDISEQVIKSGFNALQKNDIVFGPAEDGGYYLIGLSTPHKLIFENKPWSRANLLDVTLGELKSNNIKYTLLDTLNDIDTFEDLKKSPQFKNFKYD